MGDSWNKKEREKKKQQEKKDKEARKKERKENAGKDDMMAYVDENGNISDTPPDPRKKKEFKLEDIQIGLPEYVPPPKNEHTHTGKDTLFNHEKDNGCIQHLLT